MDTRVFYLASGRLLAFEWERGGPASEPEVFAADEEGLTRYSLYLEHDPLVRTYLLVDVVEEEFREETIPHVLGRDRAALVRTKLTRLFRDPTYSHAIIQGRETTGRRDDRVLFSALIRPDILAPWLGQIAKHKVPLVGIYSLPILSQSLLKPMHVVSDHALIVTLQSAGALRQTYFLDRQLVLSRLALIPRGERDRQASVVLSEVEKIRRYLSSLRLLPQDSPLDVYIVAEPRLLDDVRRLSPDSVTARHHLVPLAEAARGIGLRKYAESNADRLFAQLLVRSAPPNHYAPESQIRYHRLYQTRSMLIAGGVVLLAASLFWGGVKFIEGAVAAHETESVGRQIRFYQDRYDLARSRLPKTPVESRQLEVAVKAAGTLEHFSTTPYKTMLLLSRALADYPAIQLDSIVWKSTTNPNEQVGSVQPGEKAPAAARVPPPGAGGEPARVSYQLAQVKARIQPFSGDYRQALDLVNHFVETLRALPDVTDVKVLSMPLDVNSESKLSGDITAGHGAAGTAHFELRIAIRDKTLEAG